MTVLTAAAYLTIWLSYVLALIVATEVFGYLWHRFGAHTDILPGVHSTHSYHHSRSLDAKHEADEDFVWVLLLMVLFELAVGVGVLIGLLPGLIAIITIIVTLTVLWWNWWLHRAYHDPGHWLNQYAWFQQEKARHYIHHDQPQNNYGIASHFMDVLLNTWTESYETNSTEEVQ